MSAVADLDLVSTATFADGPPHAYFDYLRGEDPVHLQDNPLGGRLWSLTRHADVRAMSRDTERFTSERGFMFPNHVEPGSRTYDNLMFHTGGRHQRLRGFVADAFSPRVVVRFDHWIREICVRIVREVREAGRFDAIPMIAAELPAQVVASILGVPEEDRSRILAWATGVFGRLDPEIGPSGYFAARAESEGYALELREMKRGRPQADMATELMAAVGEGGPITDGEYQQSVFSLMLAGFETTHTLIAQSLLLMATDDDARRQIEEAPPEAARDVLEELLRMVTPVNAMGRTATQDLEIHGRRIAEGDFVLMWYTAANRDPAVYENPHRFDYRRPKKGNVAFGGGGPHFCVGAHLARLEVLILLEELRKAGLRLELDGVPTRAVDVSINALRKLPMRVAG